MHILTVVSKKHLLSPDKLDKLNRIGFYWSFNERVELNWQKMFFSCKNYVEANGNSNLPSKVDGKTNVLYNWVRKQKNAFEAGNLTEDQASKLQNLGLI